MAKGNRIELPARFSHLAGFNYVDLDSDANLNTRTGADVKTLYTFGLQSQAEY